MPRSRRCEGMRSRVASAVGRTVSPTGRVCPGWGLVVSAISLLGLWSWACRGGSDNGGVRDAGGLDAAVDALVGTDAGVDGGSPDAMSLDGAMPDVGAGDAAPGDDASGTDAGPDGGTVQWASFVPGTSWQIQYEGALDTTVDVEVYDIDLFDTPQSVIGGLKADGREVICYFSAGSYENWRPDQDQFPSTALGNDLDGWPGERWLDIRDTTVRAIMAQRIQLAASKGCDAVDPDNVDGYSNDTGFPLTPQDQLDYNRFLAEQAHAAGLAIGLKNDLEQVTALVDDFDFAVNEECFNPEYDECDMLLPFVSAGKAVFQIQYDIGLRDQICPRANQMNLDTLFKHLSLDAWRVACR